MAVHLYCSESKTEDAWVCKRRMRSGCCHHTSAILAPLVSGGVLAAANHGPGKGTFHQSRCVATAHLVVHMRLAEYRTEKNTGHTHIADKLKTKLAAFITTGPRSIAMKSFIFGVL